MVCDSNFWACGRKCSAEEILLLDTDVTGGELASLTSVGAKVFGVLEERVWPGLIKGEISYHRDSENVIPKDKHMPT